MSCALDEMMNREEPRWRISVVGKSWLGRPVFEGRIILDMGDGMAQDVVLRNWSKDKLKVVAECKMWIAGYNRGYREGELNGNKNN